MNDSANWQEGNARYLSAAIAWLRLCLEGCAARQQGPPAEVKLALPAQKKDDPKSIWWKVTGRPNEPPARTQSLLLPPSAQGPDQTVAQAAAAMQAAADEVQPPPALLMLRQRLGLSQFEQEILLLCVGIELDSGIAALCAQCQKDSTRTHSTFALALSIFDDPSWDALSPERPLRYWRLLEIMQTGSQSLTTSALRADERILNYIKGLNYLDDRLAPLLSSIEVPANPLQLPPSQQTIVDTIVRRIKQNDGGSLPVVQLLGSDNASKQLIASEVANALDLHLCRLPANLLPSQVGDLETLTRLWQRESLLLPLALYLDVNLVTTEGASPERSSSVSRMLERIEGAVFLNTREAWTDLNKASLPVDVVKPTAAEQASAWESALGLTAGKSPALLSEQFSLSLTAIRQIAHDVLSDTKANDQAALHDRLWQACLMSSRPQLDALAQRIVPKATWDDIVLPPTERDLLQQIAEQVAQRNTVYQKWGFAQKTSRGLGISALFAGDSGTGKTMAAEVIANQLQLSLHRIDLSAVVSKYIGQTEKNLRQLFDAGENGGAILFFDEADALFGKRSEVKESHDRFANIEINYLLQRIEAYTGLAILATNMKSALDPAFLRRLRFIVNFPFPAAEQRKAMWQKVFPPDTPTGDLDFDRLARLNLTGGHIYNIALNAAFLAARAGTSVTMPIVLEAARAEFRKLDRPINEMDFRWREKSGAVA